MRIEPTTNRFEYNIGFSIDKKHFMLFDVKDDSRNKVDNFFLTNLRNSFPEIQVIKNIVPRIKKENVATISYKGLINDKVIFDTFLTQHGTLLMDSNVKINIRNDDEFKIIKNVYMFIENNINKLDN